MSFCESSFRSCLAGFEILIFGIPPTIYRAQNPETPKSLKKSPERSLGPPTRDPLKGLPKKVRKVKKIFNINYFFKLSDFFGGLFEGSRVGAPKLRSGDFLRLFGVLGSVDGRGDPKYRVPGIKYFSGLWPVCECRPATKIQNHGCSSTPSCLFMSRQLYGPSSLPVISHFKTSPSTNTRDRRSRASKLEAFANPPYLIRITSFRNPLQGPPTQRVPKPPQQQKTNSKTQIFESPLE